MKSAKSFLTASALALAAGIPSLATAQPAPSPQEWGQQNYGYQDRDYNRDRDDYAPFRKGVQEGRKDAQHRRSPRPDHGDRWHERDDRQAYARGYWQGYDSVRQNGWHGDRDGDRNRDRD